jgi:hypothetical protein
MNFDLESKVLSSAIELFGFALNEASSEAQFHQAVEDVVREVMMRYPDIPIEQLTFALGRALGKLEGEKRGKRL